MTLYLAVRDGLLRLPPNQGTPPKWIGSLGLELIEAVEAFQAGTLPAMSVTKAIKALQEQYPDKWGVYDFDYLQKRFYQAKTYWSRGRRLIVLSDRWHEDHHMFSARWHTKKS